MYKLLKSPNINGWLVVDKPMGIGSTDIVNIVKKKFGIKKVGHGGTLDPQATGILPIAIGEATKTLRLTENLLKTYEFTVSFGFSTDTDDETGNIIRRSKNRPSTKKINQVIKNFEGEIEQLPPKLSAIKVNGKRAYDLFRKGLEFKLSPRKVLITDINIIERKNDENIDLKIICGKGFYVRSLARDLGNALGCYAHAKNIRRTEYGPFKLNNCIMLENLKHLTEKKISQNLININILLSNYTNFECTEKNLNILINGNPIKISSLNYRDCKLAWTHYKDIPIAMGKIKNSVFYPFRVLNLYNNINDF